MKFIDGKMKADELGGLFCKGVDSMLIRLRQLKQPGILDSLE